MRCVVFELAGGGTYVPPPPGRAKVAQTPGRARVNPRPAGQRSKNWLGGYPQISENLFWLPELPTMVPTQPYTYANLNFKPQFR